MMNFYMGIDVSKGYADFMLLDQYRAPVEPVFQLDDTLEGHRKLEEFLGEIFRRWPQAVVHCGLESTGAYEVHWYDHLQALSKSWPVKVAYVEPAAIRAHKKALRMQTDTDPVTARAIALYLIAYPERVRYNQQPAFRALRRLAKLILRLNQQKTQHVNQLEKLVYQYNPTMLLWWNSPLANWWLEVIRQYPTQFHLSKARAEELAQIPFLTVEKAQKVISSAQNESVPVGGPVEGQIIQALAEQILFLKKQINWLKSTLVEQVKQHPYLVRIFELWVSFSGCSDYIAASLAVYFVHPDRFATAKSASAYFGLHPVYRQSGDGSLVPHMSIRGNRVVKALLYMVCCSAISTNPVIQAVYTSALRRGKSKLAALGICMNKTLRMLWGMAKNAQPFDAELAMKHMGRHKKEREPKQKDAEHKRRYQIFDKSAPVSFRQRKQREQAESQPAFEQDPLLGDRDHQTCSQNENSPSFRDDQVKNVLLNSGQNIQFFA